MSYPEHQKVRYETRLAPEGEPVRAVILGQHPTSQYARHSEQSASSGAR